MNRRVLVTMLWKDIRQLDLMTEGFLIINEYPEEIIQMVHQKTVDIQAHLQQLSLYKEDLQEIRMPGEPEEVELEAITTQAEDDQIIEQLEPADEVLGNEDANEFEPEIQEDEVDAEIKEDDEVTEDISETNEPIAEANEATILDEKVEEDEPSITVEIEALENSTEALTLEVEDDNIIESESEIITTTEEQDEIIEDEQSNQVVIEEEMAATSEAPEEVPVAAVEQNGNLIIPGFEDVSMESADNDSKVIDENTPTFQPSLFSSTADQSQIFGVENRRITDVKKAISIGERFRFQRELFSGNGEDMNKTLTFINHAVTLSEAMDFLEKKYKWERYNESAADFYRIIKRRFI